MQHQFQGSGILRRCLGIIEDLIGYGESEQSIELIEMIEEYCPNEPEIFKNKGIALMNESRYPESIEAFTKAISLTQQHLSIHTGLAHISDGLTHQERMGCLFYVCSLHKADLLYHLGKYELAQQIYSDLTQSSDKSNHPEINYRKGLCEMGQSNHAEAIELFDLALSLNSDYDECHISKAHCLFALGSYLQVFEELDKMPETKFGLIQNPDLLYLRASCHYNLGNLQQSQKWAQRTVQMDYGHQESSHLLTIIRFKLLNKSNEEMQRKHGQSAHHKTKPIKKSQSECHKVKKLAVRKGKTLKRKSL